MYVAHGHKSISKPYPFGSDIHGYPCPWVKLPSLLPAGPTPSPASPPAAAATASPVPSGIEGDDGDCLPLPAWATRPDLAHAVGLPACIADLGLGPLGELHAGPILRPGRHLVNPAHLCIFSVKLTKSLKFISMCACSSCYNFMCAAPFHAYDMSKCSS